MNTYAAYHVLPFNRRARSLKGKLNFKFATYMMIFFIFVVILSETLIS
jgi:hypothetical protein